MAKPWIFYVVSMFFLSSLAIAKTYKIERGDGNKVTWTAIGSPGFLKIEGEGGWVTGEASVVDGKASGTFHCKLDMFKTGIETRDGHMKDDYLHTKKHPEAMLKISDMAIKDDAPFKGMLTLHGVTKEVEGKAKIKKLGDGYKILATMTIALTDFKIDVPSYLGVTVAKDVDIKVWVSF